MKIAINHDSLTIGDRTFVKAPSPGDIYQLLGTPERIQEFGPPAPFGYRNNVGHYYDRLGVFHLEHHASCLVQGVSVVFEPAKAMRKPVHGFNGAILFAGVHVDSNSDARDLLAQSNVRLGRRFNTEFVHETIDFSIRMEVFPHTRNQYRVAAASFGFRGKYVRESKSSKHDQVESE